MIHDRLPLVQRPDESRERGRGWFEYTYPCSCGAWGPWRKTADDARADWYWHELNMDIEERAS